MRLKIALAGAFVVGLVLPAAAQTTTTSYYVVQDVKTKKCTIIDKKPTTTEYTTVGDDGVVYKNPYRGGERDENRQGVHDRVRPVFAPS